MQKQKHTVEKIGGTSMTRFRDIMKNVIKGNRCSEYFYYRIFVVSAYGGVTNLLLEDKKTGAPGVYGLFAKGDHAWLDALEKTRLKMLELNQTFADIGLDTDKADAFVDDRVAGIKACLNDLMRLRSYGHFKTEDYLPASRELLSAIGEAHSAYNSSLILQANGVNAVFADLTGWKDTQIYSLNEMIMKCFKDIDYSTQLPVATGYVKCSEGLMNRFDRGYSEITFSKIAVLTDACEGIIHKEFHLSTGDPNLIGRDKVEIIGNTNFDIADQLADMDMEAIHAKASKEMELKYIPIRVKNAFDPEHPGTLISHDYISPNPRVEMICGRSDVVAVEIMDVEMVSESGYDYKLLEIFYHYNISYIAKNTNANTITHYVPEKARNLKECLSELKKKFPNSSIRTTPIAIVSVIGTNMKIPGFLSKSAQALADAHINILALDQCMRQVSMQFMVGRSDFNNAQIALHNAFVENK